MPLPLLNNPSIIASVGTVFSITNYQDAGGQGATWGVDQVEQVWQGARTYRNKLRVITTHAYVGPAAILSSLVGIGVVLGNYYVYPLAELNGSGAATFATEQDTGSFIQIIDVEQDPNADDARQWIVTVSYGPFDIQHELGTSNATFGSFTPLDFPLIIRWGTNKYHRYYPQDSQGNPYRNTAGDPFDNPPPREESTQLLTIIDWAPNYSEPFAQTFRDTTNSDTFLGFNPQTVLCKDIDGERIYTADYGYVWRIVFQFEIRQITIVTSSGSIGYGWQEPILNSGFRAFGGAGGGGGALAPILIGGQPISSPVVLNQNGTYTVPVNQGAVTPTTGDQTAYILFQPYPTSTFADLGIPPDILTQNQ
jgi:hypothetical protein